MTLEFDLLFKNLDHNLQTVRNRALYFTCLFLVTILHVAIKSAHSTLSRVRRAGDLKSGSVL